MILFLVLAAGLWLLGAAFGTSHRMRWTTIAILYAAVLLGLAASPVSFAAVIGGSAGEWAMLGAFGALIWGYSRIIRHLKSRSVETVNPVKSKSFSQTELNRYARHIVLREIGGPGQKRLKDAKILVIGAGGLGAPVLQYLAAAGVGTIGVVDDDVVDNSNLQRQVIHKDTSIGMPKVFSARDELIAQNPAVAVRPYHRRLTADIADDLMGDYDLILDGTDNFDTRYLVNRAAVRAGKPLISGALSQWEGQVTLFDPAHGSPCYECVFPEPPAPGLAPSCSEAGVLGPLPGVIGSMMAVEAIKHIAKAGETLAGRMLIYDALYADTRVIRLKKRADCAACGPSA